MEAFPMLNNCPGNVNICKHPRSSITAKKEWRYTENFINFIQMHFNTLNTDSK